jgi:transposase-like protein
MFLLVGSSLDAYFFLAKVKTKCKGKPLAIFVDKGPWYVNVLAKLYSKEFMKHWREKCSTIIFKRL